MIIASVEPSASLLRSTIAPWLQVIALSWTITLGMPGIARYGPARLLHFAIDAEVELPDSAVS